MKETRRNPRISKSADESTRASLHRAVDRATPEQRVTLFVLAEHPGLLRAMDAMLDELQEGLR